MIPAEMFLAALLAPVLTAFLIPLARRWPNAREGLTLVGSTIAAAAVVALAIEVVGGARPSVHITTLLPGLDIAFAVEPLGALFALVAGTLWLANSVYSIGYMRGNREPRQTTFYVLFAVAIASALGIAFSGNLFTLFLFYETLTLATYPLVTHKGTPEAMRGGRTYLVTLMSTSIGLLLPAIAITGYLAGTLDFTEGGILGGTASTLVLAALLGLFVFGIGKAAMMPVHFWLPAAMVAPTPVSALLHAVAVVKAGVFAIVKVIVYIFGVGTLTTTGAGDWLLYAAGFTVLTASLIALRQTNLKRMLAFSTISQLSYVILAAAILVPISITAAALHIAAHAVSKITLFFAAGSFYTAAHATEINQLRGIGRRMPWTMAAFAIGALSMIGIPPTAGFLSKWFMLSAAMDSAAWFAVGVIVISTILNASYFLPIIWRAFWSAPEAGHGASPTLGHGEAPLPIVLALSATALATVALFFFPSIPFDLSELVGTSL
ncbi:MAG: proton-conducting transporter transmembrane domain-containing protein [Alphaproteobacteria bacterium]